MGVEALMRVEGKVWIYRGRVGDELDLLELQHNHVLHRQGTPVADGLGQVQSTKRSAVQSRVVVTIKRVAWCYTITSDQI